MNSQKSFPRVLGIGNALVDIMTILEDDSVLQDFNLPRGSMTLVDRDLSESIQEKTQNFEKKIANGGSVANAMNGIANLSVPAGFVGSISEDSMGDFFRTTLTQNNIEPRLKVVEGRSGRAVAMVSPDGERTFGTYLGASLEMGPDDIKESLFEGYDYFMIEGYLVQNHGLIRKAAIVAKSMGMKIAIDLASYNVVEENLDILNELVDNYVDIVFANEEESNAFTKLDPRSAVDAIAKRVDIAIVKIGKDGAYIKQGDHCIQVPAFGQNPIDTTGAGDFFAAGFLAGQAKGYNLEQSGKLGSILSGHVINVLGAQLDKETWAKIIELEKALQ